VDGHLLVVALDGLWPTGKMERGVCAAGLGEDIRLGMRLG